MTLSLPDQRMAWRGVDLSWTQVDLGAPVPHTMFKVAFDEHQPDRMSCATNGGEVWSSHDGGESWAPQPPPPGGTQIYALARG